MHSVAKLGGFILVISLLCSTALAAYPSKATATFETDDDYDYMEAEVYTGWKCVSGDGNFPNFLHANALFGIIS